MSTKIALICCLQLTVLTAQAQDCVNCSCKIEAAIKSKNDGNYQAALLQLSAAATTCGSKSSEKIKEEINSVYQKIDSLKIVAEGNAKAAEKARFEAENIAKYLKKSEEAERNQKLKAEAAQRYAEQKQRDADSLNTELIKTNETLKHEQAQRLNAETQQKVFAQAELSQLKGQNALKDKKFDLAVDFFQTALQLIETFPTKDTVRLLLHGYIKEAKQSKYAQDLFNAKIKEADSLTALGRMHYSEAFDALFAAHQMGYDPDSTLRKIKNLDNLFQKNIKPGKDFIGPVYFTLMTKSFNANNLLHNNHGMNSRINSCMALYPETKWFESDSVAMRSIRDYHKSFLHRIEVFGGFKSFLPHTSPTSVMRVVRSNENLIDYPYLFRHFFLGVFMRATDKIRLGLEFSTNDLSGISLNAKLLRFGNLPEFEYIDQSKFAGKEYYSYPLPKQHDFTLLGTYKLKETVHRRWRTRQLTVECLAGITRGFGNLGFSNKYVQFVFDNGEAPIELIQNMVESSGVPNASIKLDQGAGPALYILDPNYKYGPGALENASYINFLACRTILIQLPFENQNNRYKYANGFVGLRFSYIPFPRYRIHLMGDLTYSFRVSKELKTIKFNIGEEMLRLIEQSYQPSSADLAQLSAYYLNNCNVDVAIRHSFAQFNTGLGFKLGLGFQF